MPCFPFRARAAPSGRGGGREGTGFGEQPCSGTAQRTSDDGDRSSQRPAHKLAPSTCRQQGTDPGPVEHSPIANLLARPYCIIASLSGKRRPRSPARSLVMVALTLEKDERHPAKPTGLSTARFVSRQAVHSTLGFWWAQYTHI